MTTEQAVLLSVIVATFVVVMVLKPKKTMVGGWFQRDRKGRMTLVLTPVRKKGRRKKKRRR